MNNSKKKDRMTHMTRIETDTNLTENIDNFRDSYSLYRENILEEEFETFIEATPHYNAQNVKYTELNYFDLESKPEAYKLKHLSPVENAIIKLKKDVENAIIKLKKDAE
jgi:hypothetical protein